MPAQISFDPNRAYPSIPTIGSDLDSHSRALEAIREALQTHERRTGDFLNSFVRVQELADLGLIELDGTVVEDSTPTEESTTHHHNLTYIRLDGTSNPTTGEIAFGAGIDVTGGITADSINGILAIDRLDMDHLLIGISLGQPIITVTSNGSTITLSMEDSEGVDLRFFFSSGVATIDTEPTPASIALTAGTDIVPVHNYIYVLESTGALAVSTTGWPSVEYAPVATVVCQSAASAQTDGLYKVHAWTDHAHDTNVGHLAHANLWIRSRPADWMSGTLAIVTDGAGVFDLAISSGEVLQLHPHPFPSFDTSTGSEIMVINDPTTAYTRLGDLTTILTDANGASMSNKYYNLVIWGVISEDSGDCQVMVNLPTDSYVLSSDAQVDINGTAVYDIPVDYAGVGFLIARLTMRNQTGGNTFTEELNTDLRGKFPSTTAGGSGGGGGVTELIELTDVDTAADTANFFLATPDGATGQYSGRAIVADDLPDLSAIYEPVDATLVRDDDAGYNNSNWDTAYGWGDHASGGYAADSGVVHIAGAETITGGKTFDGAFFIKERANAEVDQAGDGQFWIKNNTPNIPYFTNDAGDDQLLDPSISTINSQAGSYTLILTDKGKTIYKNSDTAGHTFTIPAFSAVAFPNGTMICIQNGGSSDLTIDLTADTLEGTDGDTGNRTLSPYKVAVIEKITTTLWRYSASDIGDPGFSHPAYTTRSINTSGAEVLDVFTSDNIGSVTDITKRTMTLSDFGFTDNSGNWDTAYGWGDHASGGYAADSGVVHIAGAETITGGKTFDGAFFIKERASAEADQAGDGQIWIKSGTPNTPWFTNDAGNDQLIDPSISTINSQNDNYTLVLTDKGKTIHKSTNLTSKTYTIPANASVAFPNGTLIAVWNGGTVDLSIAITSDTLTGTDGNTGTRTLSPFKVALIEKMTSTTWRYSASDLGGSSYSHPAYTTRSINTSGAEVLDVFTSDAIGAVTNITKRTMTLSDLGANEANWNTAYGWGNHASGGYAPTAGPTFTGNVTLANLIRSGSSTSSGQNIHTATAHGIEAGHTTAHKIVYGWSNDYLRTYQAPYIDGVAQWSDEFGYNHALENWYFEAAITIGGETFGNNTHAELGGATFTGPLHVDVVDLIVRDGSGNAKFHVDYSTSQVKIRDGWLLQVQSADDTGILELSHNGTDGKVNSKAGDLRLVAAGGDIIVEDYLYCSLGGRFGSDLAALGSINLGHATDTTISRYNAGHLQVEFKPIFAHVGTTYNSADITFSTSAPSGGSDGDVWYEYS